MKTNFLLKLTTFFILLLVHLSSYAQNYHLDCNYDDNDAPQTLAAGANSEFGFSHTPSGNLHIMMIYVTFIEDDNTPGNDLMSYYWPKNNVPYYQMDLGGYSQFIDFDVNQPSNTYNLTTWFKTMSMVKDINGVATPKFSITADVFHVQITKSTISIPHDPDKNRLDEIEYEYCKRALVALMLKYPNIDWSRFDNRQNLPDFGYDNSKFKSNGSPAGGDGVIDYINFNFRLDYLTETRPIADRGGYAKYNQFSDANKYKLNSVINNSGTYSFSIGHTSVYGMEFDYAFQYFCHEFSHNLYRAQHYMGANSAAGGGLYQNNGWGIMGRIERSFLTANSWEKNFLGWAQPQTVTQQSINPSGIYTIGDFIEDQDAIRIKLPYYRWQTPGQEAYLYIENHQMINYFDKKFMWSTEAPMIPGLYMFISMADSKTVINVTTNGVNHLKVLSASGSWDFSSTLTNNGTRVFHREKRNPIGGQTQSQLIRGDYDNDGIIKWAEEGGSSNEGREIDNLDGVSKKFGTLCSDDAFLVGHKLGLKYGMPITNYADFNKVDNNFHQLDCFLNGLSIEVLSYDSQTKRFTIKVKYDDYAIETSTRFASNRITLNNLTNDANPDLIIKQGKILTIDRTGTINTLGKNPNPTLYNPTTFTLLSGSKILIEPYATISASDESKIILNTSASIELQNHSTLVLTNNSTLELKSGANLIASGDAKIVVESGSELIFNSSANINLADVLTRIELKDGGKIRIGDNSVFTWSGNGFLKINTATVGTVNIIGSGNNAKFYKKGTGALYSQKLIEVVGGGSLSVDKSLTEFRIELGKVVLDNNCLVDVESKMVCHGVKFTTPSAGLKHKGIMVYGQQNTPYLTSSTVENAQWGFMCYNNSGTANKASLLNCKFINNDLGVYINGKGADISNCTFWHNKYGAIHLDMMTLTSKLNYVNIYNNNNYPILATGTNFGLVSITNSGIYNNNSTGVYASYTTLGAGCSNISNNFDGNNLTGRNIIMAEQSVMAQEPALWPNVGNNYFFNSIGDGVITNDVKRLYLNKGNNHYQVTNGWEIHGTMPKQAGTKPAYPVVRADQNYWDLAGNAAVNRLQYWVKYEYPTSGTWRDLMITDNAPLSSPPTFSACGSGGIGSLPGTGIDNTPSILIGKPTLLLSDGKNIKDVFSQGLYDLYVDNNSLSALNNFASIANHNYSMTNNIMHCGRLTNEYAIWFEVVYTSYQKMLECLNQGISSGMIGTYQTSPYAYNLIDNTQQNLLSRTNNAGDYDYEVAVGLNLDNSILYKLEDKLEECKQKLLNLRDNEPHTSINEKLIAYTLCNVEKELQFRNHEIAKPNLRDMLFDCQSNLGLASTNDDPIGGTEPDDPNYTEYLGKTGGPIFNPFATIQAEINREYDVIKVYPNPTKGILNIYSENSKIIKIKVWDMSGKLVLEENETTQLNIANRGVYLISITTGKSTQIRKIFVE